MVVWQAIWWSTRRMTMLGNFFRSGLKQDVVSYSKSCYVWQWMGKRNNVVPIALLQTISVFDKPFSRVLVDCVGPLPKAKSSNEFLLTIMCAATCFAEAIPLKKIMAPSIVKWLPALVK